MKRILFCVFYLIVFSLFVFSLFVFCAKSSFGTEFIRKQRGGIIFIFKQFRSRTRLIIPFNQFKRRNNFETRGFINISFQINETFLNTTNNGNIRCPKTTKEIPMNDERYEELSRKTKLRFQFPPTKRGL